MTKIQTMATEHARLCTLAEKFLRGRGCHLVYSGFAIVSEIPDAMGWSGSWKNAGSIVVECKVSRQDWLRDKRKTCVLEPGIRCGRGRMGEYRYFLCPAGLLTAEDVEQHYPDHGLIVPFGRGCKIVRLAPYRLDANKIAEAYVLSKLLSRKTYECQLLRNSPLKS